MMIIIERQDGRCWDGDTWISDRGDAQTFESVEAAEAKISHQRSLPSTMAGGSYGFETARVVAVDCTPACADVLAYMAKHGVGQDEAVRCLGGEA